MKNFSITLYLVLVCSLLFAQKRDTLRVYFEHDARVPIDKEVIQPFIEASAEPMGIEVIGYTDHLGSKAYNDKLAKDRAESIAEVLREMDKSFDNRMSILGKGEIASNDAANGVPEHRRVDVILIQNTAPVPEPAKKTELRQETTNKIEALTIDTADGRNITLEGVHFIGGQHYPVESSIPVIKQLLQTLIENPDLRIEIQGFICCEYNQFDGLDFHTQTMNLSENRAKYIYDYLIDEGISSNRLSYKGYGSSRPVVFPETSEADQEANRRVEILILD